MSSPPSTPEDRILRFETALTEAANTPTYWADRESASNGAVADVATVPPDGTPQPVLYRFRRSEMIRIFRAVTQGELRLGYQPCVDVATGRVSHLEALIRWPGKPETITIQNLVNAMEGNGLILPVGAWVIRQACRDLAILRADGYRHLSMSVNVSNSQIDDVRLADQITEALEINQIPGRRLMIELTETMLPDLLKAGKLVSAMRKIGVRTMIDDFGMGFANFTLLRDVPAAAIKIDRSYTAQVLKSRRTASMTESLISMADKIGVDVIAEGVETSGQMRWMSAHGVRKLQGFFYSPAVDIEGIRCLLQVQPWTVAPAKWAAS